MSFLKNKNTVMIAIIVALILIGWGVLRNRSFDEKENITLHGVEGADRFEITSPETKHTLIKKDEEWVVSESEIEYPADASVIEEIKQTLLTLSVSDIISKNPERYLQFGVQDEQVTSVAWFVGEAKQGEVYVGRTDFVRSGDYIRINGGRQVYITKTPIQNLLVKSDYRNLTVVSFDAETVEKITWDYPDNKQNFVFITQASTTAGAPKVWSFEDGSEMIDETKVTPVISAVSMLIARSMEKPDAGKDYGFETPTLVISIYSTDGSVHVLTIGKQADEMPAYYVQVNDTSWVYLVHVATVNDGLLKEKTDFIKLVGSEGEN